MPQSGDQGNKYSPQDYYKAQCKKLQQKICYLEGQLAQAQETIRAQEATIEQLRKMAPTEADRWHARLLSNRRIEPVNKDALAQIRDTYLDSATDAEGWAEFDVGKLAKKLDVARATAYIRVEELAEYKLIELDPTGCRVRFVPQVLDNPDRAINGIVSVAQRRAKREARAAAQGETLGSWGGKREKRKILCPECGEDCTEYSHISGYCSNGHVFLLNVEGGPLHGDLVDQADQQLPAEEPASPPALSLWTEPVVEDEKRNSLDQDGVDRRGGLYQSQYTTRAPGHDDRPPAPDRRCLPCSFELKQDFRDWRWNGEQWYCARHMPEYAAQGEQESEGSQ